MNEQTSLLVPMISLHPLHQSMTVPIRVTYVLLFRDLCSHFLSLSRHSF